MTTPNNALKNCFQHRSIEPSTLVSGVENTALHLAFFRGYRLQVEGTGYKWRAQATIEGYRLQVKGTAYIWGAQATIGGTGYKWGAQATSGGHRWTLNEEISFNFKSTGSSLKVQSHFII